MDAVIAVLEEMGQAMKEGAWLEVRRKWDAKLKDLDQRYKAERESLAIGRDSEQLTLENRCLEEHGAHLDDGGFLYSMCKRCGCDLG